MRDPNRCCTDDHLRNTGRGQVLPRYWPAERLVRVGEVSSAVLIYGLLPPLGGRPVRSTARHAA
jgi:hypothetical protein